MISPNEFDQVEKISIISPCFNAEKYLEQTYSAVISQTYNNWEWIIFDDCSTDRSWEILSDLASKDSRIKIFRNQENSGAAVTRNNCLDEAVGHFIAFLDIDDLWSENKLLAQVRFMQNENIMFSHHDYKMIQANGKKIKDIVCPDEVSAKSILRYNPFATSAVMMRKKLISEKTIRFRIHLRRRQDYLFWFECLEQAGRSVKCPGVLSDYRVFGGDSLSGDKKKMAVIQWGLYRREFGLGFLPSCYYFLCYAVHGIKKYFIHS